jgi:two-component system, OmpR family, response regulator
VKDPTSLRSATAAVHRTQTSFVDEDVYDDGCLRIEHSNYYASVAGERIPLSLKEFRILSCLSKKPERVLPTRELWRQVWGRKKPADEATLRVHIYRLRQKLMRYGVTVENMPTVGYRLVLAHCCKGKLTVTTQQST